MRRTTRSRPAMIDQPAQHSRMILLGVLAAVGLLVAAWWAADHGGGRRERLVELGVQPPAHVIADGLRAGVGGAQRLVTVDSERRVAAELQQLAVAGLLVLDLEGSPVSGLRLGMELDPSGVVYDLERLPVIEPLGVTDPAGMLALPPLTASTISLVSQDPRWLIVGSSVLSAPWVATTTVRVRSGGGIRGRVVGSNGPIEGATVGALASMEFGLLGEPSEPTPSFFDPANVRRARTDHVGRFELFGLLPSASRLDVLASDHAPLSIRFEGPKPGEVVDLGTVVVQPGLAVVFRVSSAGAPVHPARLMIEANDDSYTRGNGGLDLDERGEVHVPGMSAGDYVWMLERPGALAQRGRARVPDTGGLVLVEAPRLRALELVVTDSRGAAVEHFVVRAKEKRSQTRRMEGSERLSIRCSEGSVCQLTVEADGFAPSPRLEAPPDQTHIEVRLLRPGRLSLALAGVEGLGSIRLATLESEQADLLELVARGITPLPLPELALEGGQVALENLTPGKHWVVLESNGGPQAFGPFDVQENTTTSAEIVVVDAELVDGLVVDASTRAPLPDVAVHVGGGTGEGAGLTLLFRTLMRDDAADAVSGEDGRFSVPVKSRETSSLVFERSGYERNSISLGSLEDRAELSVELQPLPAATLQVLFADGVPAAGARVEFARGDGAARDLLGSARTDEEGVASLVDVAAGLCRAMVHARDAESVRYRAAFPELEVQEGARLRLVLAPDPRWIVIPPEVASERGAFLARREAVLGAGWIEVCWAAATVGANPPTPPELRVPPGSYRIELETPTGPRVAVCEVRAGERVTPEWLDVSGELLVEVVGSSWSSARLGVEVREGAAVGYTTHLELQRGSSGARLAQLPRGRVQVTLRDWTRTDGTLVPARWTRSATLSQTPEVVRFDVTDVASVDVRVVDEAGRGLPGIAVQCVTRGVSSSAPSHETTAAMTGTDGVARLWIPPGEAVIAIDPPDRAAAVLAMGPARSRQVELVSDEGGRLRIVLPDRPAVRAWTLRVLPAPDAASPPATALLAAMLERRVGRLASLEPGGSATMTRLAAGSYSVVAVDAGQIVVSAQVVVRAGRTTTTFLDAE